MSVNLANIFKRAEWRLTNSFATSTNDISSTIACSYVSVKEY